QLIDLLVAMLVTFSGISILAVYVSKSYQGETNRIEQLMKELAFNNEKLEESAIRDALTGVYNRRFLTDFLERELKSCVETNSHVFVFMLDIDFFKKVNDQYGHGTGDEVLKVFAKTVRDSLRPSDVVARYGGEEFVAVLHIEDYNAAFAIAERVRLAISALEFRYGLKITSSFGVAKSNTKDTAESILDKADVCLYKAKQTGRNKVVMEE
uniref:GGDEF domain-containing protein n=1 Tax=Anaerosporobacter sp. TaxID=1872529 RepID=UPI00286EEE96